MIRAISSVSQPSFYGIVKKDKQQIATEISKCVSYPADEHNIKRKQKIKQDLIDSVNEITRTISSLDNDILYDVSLEHDYNRFSQRDVHIETIFAILKVRRCDTAEEFQTKAEVCTNSTGMHPFQYYKDPNEIKEKLVTPMKENLLDDITQNPHQEPTPEIAVIMDKLI